MVISLLLHMLRVFVTSAFRDFRWGAWVCGVGLLGVAFGLAFTGYSLVYQQLSYWAMTVTSNIMGSVPIIGATLKSFFLAGPDVNPATLSRMYALHVQVLPASIIALIGGHIFFVRLLGLHKPGSEKDVKEEDERMEKEGPYHFFPDHILSETAVFLYFVLVIILLAIAVPAVMGEPADPTTTPEHIKPEWYFLPFFHMLKLVPGTAGIIIMGVIATLVVCWPVIDHYIFQRIDKALNWRFECSLIFGLIAIGFYMLWAVVETVV